MDVKISFQGARTRFASAFVAVILGTGLTGCGVAGSPGTGAEPLRHDGATLEVGDPIPVPSDPQLKITGTIGQTNRRDSLLLDVETLGQMPQAEATLFEPFLKQDVRFEGVLLSDLFRYVQPDAASVELTALDDYRVRFSLDELEPDRVLLAIAANGAEIPIADGGPTRIVFLDAEQGLGANTDHWIWSVSDIEFEGA